MIKFALIDTKYYSVYIGNRFYISYLYSYT